jgi:membrane-associated phospholipid phosphatase
LHYSLPLFCRTTYLGYPDFHRYQLAARQGRDPKGDADCYSIRLARAVDQSNHWPRMVHPRPFMIGLGHTLIPHVADSSFPSDHLTLWWAVTFSLAMQRGPRMAGLILAPLGIPIAWARIYLGVHFPFDMFGAVIVAWLSVWLSLRKVHWYLQPSYRFACHLHQRLFGRLIALGWVRN